MDKSALKTISGDPGAFLQKLDLVTRRALFVRVTRQELERASFLDERLGMQGREGFWASLGQVGEIASTLANDFRAPCFIFHIGHCGSTLLSRLLDTYPDVLGLREPVPLRDLAITERDLGSPLGRLNQEQWDALLHASLKLLCRPFSSRQQTVIKATSSCNNLVGPILRHESKAKAVLLCQRLEPHLATILKGAGGGMDALQSAPARLAFLHDFLDDNTLRLHAMETSEMVAMGWVAELARFHQLMAGSSIGPRLLLLDFERMLADMPNELTNVLHHLGLSDDRDPERSAKQVAVMRSYAKSPTHDYSPGDRKHDLDLSRRTFAADIERGMRWAIRLIESSPRLAVLRSMLE